MINEILEKPDLSEVFDLIAKVKAQIEGVIIGKSEAVQLALMAFLAKGHVLLEDMPGTGKTTLAKTIACSLGCSFKRIQFTPDLMPSDITGMNYYNTKTGEFEYRPGPIITNVLLADEINRTTPRTQSALLEAMEEKQVTVDGTTHPLLPPFLVMATQNPIESEGTFPLPYAQQDRFLIKIKLGYPSRTDEEKIIKRHAFAGNAGLSAVLTPEQAVMLQEASQSVHLDETLIKYILDYIEITRKQDDIELPLSPRATLAMIRAVKARALLEERDYVLPDDVKALAVAVFAHRIKLKKSEKYKGRQAEDYIRELTVKIPLNLKV